VLNHEIEHGRSLASTSKLSLMRWRFRMIASSQPCRSTLPGTFP